MPVFAELAWGSDMQQESDYFARNSGKDPIDYRKRLHDARAAANAGRYDEALDGYIWFHENSVNAPGMAGVRLSFALFYWIKLGQAYPPARVALEAIRDRKSKSLLNGIRDVPFFHDVVAINKHLGCERATYELFVALNSTSPLLARDAYAELAMPAIVNCGDFELARIVMPDHEEQLQRCALVFRLQSGRVDFQTCIRLYANRVKLLLKTLLGIGDTERAERLRTSALESFDSAEVREAVRVALEAAD